MVFEHRTLSAEETEALGHAIGKRLKQGDTLLLEGDLGAGKTTLTKGIGRALDVKSNINSPTFTILKIHHGKWPLYHMDVYRLDGIGDDFDLEDYIEADGITVIEWASNIGDALPLEYLLIDLKLGLDGQRIIHIKPVGKHYETMMEGWS